MDKSSASFDNSSVFSLIHSLICYISSYSIFNMGGPSPCASCKLRRRRCATDCIFSPHFPSDDPQKFAVVYKVFGASKVSKLLQGLSVHQRGDAVRSLVYEANARVRDPVNGCVGDISLLHNQVSEVKMHHAMSQAQVPCIQNHEVDKGGKGKEAFEVVSVVAAGDKKHEAAESSNAAVKCMRFTFDLNQLPSGEDEVVAGDKKHEAESSDAAAKRMRFTFDLNQLPHGEDEHIMP